MIKVTVTYKNGQKEEFIADRVRVIDEVFIITLHEGAIDEKEVLVPYHAIFKMEQEEYS